MQLLLIAALVLFILLMLGVYLFRRPGANSRNKPKQRSLEALDTLTSWQPQATRVLTTAERRVYNSLRAGLPEHIILAQVPLARFLKVPTRHSYAEWLRRVGLMCADLVVCDSASQVVAVIDIRVPAAQENERARHRHARMDRVIEAAGIPLHVWREDALPTGTAARNAILGIPVAPPADGSASTSTAAARHTLPDLNYEPPMDDEIMEPGEPPPSTWFDDLDTSPTPLGPPIDRDGPRSGPRL